MALAASSLRALARCAAALPRVAAGVAKTATATAPRHMLSTSATSADGIDHLLKQNKAWAASLTPELLESMGKGQWPEYLWIGCADSRVPASQVLGLQPGQMFTVRNVGNLVHGNDLSVLAAIEFSVEKLPRPVNHVIVCGHYGCGAVKAASDDQDIGLVGHWISAIRDVRRLHDEELTNVLETKGETAFHRRLVELSTAEQAINVMKLGVVQRRMAATNPELPPLQVHAVVKDPATGLVTKLGDDVKARFEQLGGVYKFN